MKHSILCVDDEIDNVEALERLFRPKYRVLKALSGDEGLEILKNEQVSLIISDQRMPKMTGVEFLKKSVKTHPEALRILLTGYTDIDSVIAAINAGEVYRYLTKPWDPVDLSTTVHQAIERFELRQELQEKNLALEKAFSELKTLDEAKNQFMILINHELKTPLTVISSFLQLLGTESLSEEQSHYVARIQSASDRLQKMVNESLELVSAESGHRKIKVSKLTTSKIFTQISGELQDALEEKGQSLSIEDPKIIFKADPEVVRSVLSRLLENAVKFGSKNSIIELGAIDIDKEIELYVINEGTPIPISKIEKILKPFTLDEDIMHHSQGTGLGLALSQALLKTHQSALSFDSPQKNIRVSFRLAKSGPKAPSK